MITSLNLSGKMTRIWIFQTKIRILNFKYGFFDYFLPGGTSVRHFIFLTHEGLTKTPNLEDVDNLQVVDFAKGESPEAAFETVVRDNGDLDGTGFDEVFAMELKDKSQYHFQLNTAAG